MRPKPADLRAAAPRTGQWSGAVLMGDRLALASTGHLTETGLVLAGDRLALASAGHLVGLG